MTAQALRIARTRPQPPRTPADVLAAWLDCPSKETSRTRKDAVRAWCDYLGLDHAQATARLLAGPQSVGDGLLDGFAAWMTDAELSPATIKTRLACLRSLLRKGRRAGLADWTPERMDALVEPIAFRDLSGPSESELAALLDAGDRMAKPKRNRAMLLMLATLGVRRRAVAELGVADVVWRGGCAIACWTIWKGRGNQKRRMDLGPAASQAMTAWLAQRGDRAGRVFGLSGGGLGNWLAKCKREAGVTGRCNPHAFRHSAGTRAYGLTGDIMAVKELLGHTSVRTTQVYVDAVEGTQRKVSELLEKGLLD